MNPGYSKLEEVYMSDMYRILTLLGCFWMSILEVSDDLKKILFDMYLRRIILVSGFHKL